MNFEHKKLVKEITLLGKAPLDSEAFSNWLHAESHLNFLQKNAQSDELVIDVSSKCIFIHSVVIPNSNLSQVDKDELSGWNLSPYNSIASYVMGGGRDDVWIERGSYATQIKSLENAMQLIFKRNFEGWTGQGRDYIELHQEYAHLSRIHWRPEKRAYCCFDDLGDLMPVVSITTREQEESNLDLVSFKWQPLEEYLLANKASLVRLFDFTFFKRVNLMAGLMSCRKSFMIQMTYFIKD